MFSGPRRRHLPPAPTRAARAAAGGSVLVAVVLAATLTACGGADSQAGQAGGEPAGSSRAARLVQAAYEKTTAAGTVTISFEGSAPEARPSDGPAGPPDREQTVSGEAQIDFDEGASVVAVKAAGSPGSETRTIAGVQYQEVPKSERDQVPGKKPWVRIDMVEVGKLQYGERAAEIAEAPPFDPAAVFPYLRAVRTAEESGTAEVRGTATKRYDVTVDLQKGSGGHGPQLEQQTMQLQQQLGRPTLPIRVWLDEQGRIRRIEAKLPAGGGPGAQQSITVTEDFHDYGAPVGIEPPAKGRTADVTEQVIQQQLMQQQQQQQQQQQPQQPQPQQPQPQPSAS